MNRLVQIFLIILLWSACHSEDQLVNHYLIEYPNPPYLGALGSHIKARMISETEAIAYNGYLYYTDDKFDNVRFFDPDVAYTSAHKILYYLGSIWSRSSYNTDELTQVRITTTGTIKRILHLNQFFYPIYHNLPGRVLVFSDPYFFNDENWIVFAEREFGTDKHLDCYAAVGNKSYFLSTITANYSFVSFKSFENNFYLLAADPGRPEDSFIFVSNDAGSAWAGPFPVPGTFGRIDDFEVTPAGIVAFNKGHVCSSTDGKVWQNHVIPLQEMESIEYAQVVGANLIYVVASNREDRFGVVSRLYKSDDNGNTWTVDNVEFYGEEISFVNSQTGLSFSKRVLQVTRDGGETWKPVILSPDS